MRSIPSIVLSLLMTSIAAYADTTLNLTPGVSPISHDIYQLHMTVFWICVVIGVVVFGAMFYAMFHFRKSRGAKAAEFHSHPGLEVTWTILPFIILIAMAFPATKVLMRMNNTDIEDMTIKITGYQWKWHYDYFEDGLSFFSNLATPLDQINNTAPKTEMYLREVDHPLVLPIHKKIRFLITSNDVNHAWWVADLGVKRDAIPGFINEAWTIIEKPGTYHGQCAELCGINHAFMPITVIAMTQDAYKNWVAQQKGANQQSSADLTRVWTKEELMAQGQKVYNGICAACHQPTGVGLPPTFPALKGSKIATGPVEKHVETVLNGVSGTAMQAFKNQLSEVDLASVITYERNSFGNNTNTIVQPAEIKAFKEGKPLSAAVYSDSKAAPATAATSPSASGTTAATPAIATATPAANAPTAPATPAPASPAVTPAADTTAAAKTFTLQELMQRGEKVYNGICVVCHQPGGTGMPPTFPALKGSKVTTGPVEKHIQTVLFGVPNTAMQAFKDQLSDEDLASVITFERNSWGNNTGTLVQPADIAKARNAATNNNSAGGQS